MVRKHLKNHRLLRIYLKPPAYLVKERSPSSCLKILYWFSKIRFDFHTCSSGEPPCRPKSFDFIAFDRGLFLTRVLPCSTRSNRPNCRCVHLVLAAITWLIGIPINTGPGRWLVEIRPYRMKFFHLSIFSWRKSGTFFWVFIRVADYGLKLIRIISCPVRHVVDRMRGPPGHGAIAGGGRRIFRPRCVHPLCGTHPRNTGAELAARRRTAYLRRTGKRLHAKQRIWFHARREQAIRIYEWRSFMTPTPKQLAVLTAIRDSRRRRGFSPTMQELADLLGVSKVTIFEHVQALERKGLLERKPHKARSLTLHPAVKLPDETTIRTLPLVGSIAAGRPIDVFETPDSVDMEQLFSSRHGAFMLRVRGESMIEDHIADGDIVIVEQRAAPRDGEIVVALLPDGTATLKRFYRENDRIRLQPANGAMEPIYAGPDLKIQGVAIGVLRSFRRAAAGEG